MQAAAQATLLACPVICDCPAERAQPRVHGMAEVTACGGRQFGQRQLGGCMGGA